MHLSADVLFSKLSNDLKHHIDLSCPSWSVDSTATQVACYNLRSSLLKKFNEDDRPSVDACKAALKKFVAVNNRMSQWTYAPSTWKDEELVGAVKARLEDFWYVGGDKCTPICSDFRQLYIDGRAGPGASVSARGMDFYTKMFDSPLSATPGLPENWERCVSMDDRHFLAEARRLTRHGTTETEASNYSFVNKTSDIARGICIEPSINMWFQLGLGAILERRLKTYFRIDLSSQPDRNRALAYTGSVDGSVSTIDLESASDSLGLGMLKLILPRNWLTWLMLLRCPTTRLPTGSVLELNMVSTMGNGFTFPLQTAVFACIVSGVADWHGVKLSRDCFGVFGDDIICPTELSRDVLRVLNLLGFVVNDQKTFVEGPFRESCGADFFLGVNVRGVYIKSLNSEQDVYKAINSLNLWSARTGVVLNETVCYLLSGLRRIYYVPLDEAADCGLQTPRSYRPIVVRKGGKTKKGQGRDSYLAYKPVTSEFFILGGVVWTYASQVERDYNPYGLLLAFLGGFVRGYKVTVRRRTPKYATKRLTTPCWDRWVPPETFDPRGSMSIRRFVDAWHWNLLGSSALDGG